MVKFFYNILVHSKKLFGVGFNLVQGSSDCKRDELKSSISKEQQIQLQRSRQIRQQQQRQGAISVQSSSLKNGPTSAFEIAFGTSKLPPVTDYAEMNKLAYQYYKQSFDQETYSNKDEQQEQTELEPLRAEQQQHSPAVSNVQKSSAPCTSHASVKRLQANSHMDDFFGDDFFYDLPDVDSGLLGDTLSPSLYNVPGLTTDANQAGLGMEPGGGSARSNITGTLLSSSFDTNTFVGNAYNSLNEIDFTNVDLNSQFDGATSMENSGSGINDQPTDDNHLSGLSNLHLQFTD